MHKCFEAEPCTVIKKQRAHRDGFEIKSPSQTVSEEKRSEIAKRRD